MKRDFTVIEEAEKIGSNGNHLPTGKQILLSSGHRRMYSAYFLLGLRYKTLLLIVKEQISQKSFLIGIRGTHFSKENKSAFLEYSKQVNATGMGCKVFFSSYKEILQG